MFQNKLEWLLQASPFSLRSAL